MRWCLTLLAMIAVGVARAADAPKQNSLTPQEIAEGWVQLFDGETAFGWKIDGEATAKNGVLIFGGTKETTIRSIWPAGELHWEYYYSNQLKAGMRFRPLGTDEWSTWGNFVGEPGQKTWNSQWIKFGKSNRASINNQKFDTPNAKSVVEKNNIVAIDLPKLPVENEIHVSAGATLSVRNVKFKPSGLEPISNGKDLSGWKRFTTDEKRAKSKFTVTPEGWINVKNGPGDLQTEKQWADFVFQGECISNGKALNSGVFFRCIPGQYQNGYEYQIHNGFKDNDRTKPADFGTGAIYRRIAARKVVPNDHEWFTMTLIANGRHISTWVNGYQTVDWTDERKENDNARNGCKLGAGPISLQGHDPTTDLSFRNLRIAELKK